MFKIEKDIPIPTGKNNSKFKELLEIMSDMQVGDSILIVQIKSTNQCHSLLFRHLKPFKFISRMVENGIRIWRVE